MNDQMMRLAKEAGFLDGDLELFPETIERFAELVRADEREDCAKLCESEGHRIDASWESCATAIRAKGNYEDAPLP